MYNFSMHPTLKACGSMYTKEGPEGLIRNKKAYLTISTGDVYTTDPMRSVDYTESYFRKILKSIGVNDITT
jgi:FMN-dependent NADH-azoreductase